MNCVKFSPDGKNLSSCLDDGTVRLFNVETGLLNQTFEGHLKEVCGVCFSEDGKLIASASWDESVKIWIAEANQINSQSEGH